MAKEGLYKFYGELPTWAKGIIGVAIVGGIGIIGYTVYKKLSKSQSEKDAEESLKDTNEDIKKLLKTQKPSYIPAQYGAFSDALFEAMSGGGTDEDAIFEIFKKTKNTLDVLLIVKAFGIREYTDDKFLMFNIKPMNLNQWLSAELSQIEKNKLNQILTSKGIKFQF